MLCPKCFGQRVLETFTAAPGEESHARKRILSMPCPECQGQGVTYCCEGPSEQPEQFAS